MLDIDTMLELHQNIVLRGIGDKYWALNTSTGDQFKLNELSYFILEHFRRPQTISQIAEIVLKEYDVARECVVDDCRIVLQFAIENQILNEVKS